MSDVLAQLSGQGVSIWLDDLSRELIDRGELQRLIDEAHVVGVTTNPTIFASALAHGEAYTPQLRELAASGADAERAVFAITTCDVQHACDLFAPVYERSGGVDGRVSIEVDPRLAHDTAKTVETARALFDAVQRPNVLIKIPATVEGLAAISQTLAEGISVNVTLIFSLDRYRAVMQAFLTGLEQAREAGRDLSEIESVASFFVSRLDTEVDRRLDELGTDDARALRGKAALANARLAFAAYEEVFATPRWQVLAQAGAHPQRPLWASTGVKDKAYPDTMYITELVTRGTVNTMPRSAMDAVADHGELRGDTVRGAYDDAGAVLDALERLGISYTEVTALLEREGVEKFDKSWSELLATVERELARVGAPGGESTP